MFFRKIGGFVSKIKHYSLNKFSNCLYKYAGFVYDRPYTIIFLSLIGCGLLSTGFYYKENEKDVFKLYSIANAYTYDNGKMINDFFHRNRNAIILIESNFNLLQGHILNELKKFEDNIFDIQIDCSEVLECKVDDIGVEQTEVAKKVFDKLNKNIDPNVNYDWKPSLSSLNFKFSLNNLLRFKKKNKTNLDKSEETDDDEDEEDEEKEEPNNNEDMEYSGIRTKLKNGINFFYEKIEILKKLYTSLKGKKIVMPHEEKIAPTFEEFENDVFYPPYYIPPLLVKNDRCILKNVFQHKKLDINLRTVSDSLKKEITFKLDDLCQKKYGQCERSSIFLYYENGNAKIGDPIKVDNLNFYVNRKSYKGMILKSIFGNPQYTQNGSNYVINYANSLVTILHLHNSYTYEPYALAFEKKLIDYVRNYNINHAINSDEETNDGNPGYVRFHVFAERSFEDEVDRISKLDKLTMLLFLIGIFFIFMYVLFNNVTSVLYRSKPLCAIVGIFCGFLGYLAGFGFLFFIGIKTVPPAETVPFLVIGVCVDDVFVIINSYSLLFMIKDDRKRIQMCLRDSAVPITVTTLTNVIAFLISAVSPFYAIYSFSLFTTSALFFSYILVITILVSILCIEARLEKEKKNIFSPIISLVSSCFCKDSINKINNSLPNNNELSLEILTEEEQEKACAEYESLSIYQWIHNLYLFEESINNKKNKPSSKSKNKGDDQCTIVDVAPGGRDFKGCKQTSKHRGNYKNTSKCITNSDNNLKKNIQDSTSKVYPSNVNQNIQKTEHDNSNIYSHYNINDDINRRNDINGYDGNENEELSGRTVEYDNTKINNNYTSQISLEKDLRSIEVNSSSSVLHISNDISSSCLNNSNAIQNLKNDDNDCSKNEYNKDIYNNNEGNRNKAKDCEINNYTKGENKKIYMLSSHDNVLFYKYIYKEPKGNIGKCFRKLIKNYYIPFLSSRIGKTIVYLLFSFIIILSIYGCTFIKKGIRYVKAFPSDSYIRMFIEQRAIHFPNLGDIIEVYYFDKNFLNKYRKLRNEYFDDDISNSYLSFSFSNNIDNNEEPSDVEPTNTNIRWEKTTIHEKLKQVHENLDKQDFIAGISNGFNFFVNNNSKQLESEDPDAFYNTFINWVKYDYTGNMFKDDFIFLNKKLVAWRFKYVQKNTDDSEDSSMWLKKCNEIAKIEDENIQLLCFHISSIFYETDEIIMDITLKTMGITIFTILFVTAYIVEGFSSCFIIAMIILLIDLSIFGFMCLCGITVNIISMVILVLSIGFSIDHTSHIVQAFTHSVGRTRNEKMKESLYLMMGPVLHSGLSTWCIISTLFFSNKDFTVIFFQTLSLVLFFSVIYSSMFLPVLLSSIGPL
ncbi:lipid/sterol:H+ symporter, putative [Plasmodium berghei]|uniref:Niemann-Pick type C1-related protein, putative n=2 Tax=Plasmodium berghei TaxID=5821 RepID=A0A509AGL4_PLABA|nr:Niemann-Pick type C1-related protein, putative [Plasmodium berghei ANKA]CXH87015.1 lipid/sterol:H+ symporter, putative [Plasmodium berghei]SCL90063.1 lipid/sterol:H+ symporter, putative [Plasmodium berghei]SCM15209.1 lipid/sterol:H+ symporter, putative [Plasmodium berghei]SCM17004.1 lipid/sterol:H+ symporter, putative [Plasmodium berghei]SCN21850.1 lipid/sterol:H+ symporter, putative [Plasmodium berghei]|eukprot:XP_034419785.1 Niemann-Pick type C1-related protein, putative [Plasmodium berghei ANKA]